MLTLLLDKYPYLWIMLWLGASSRGGVTDTIPTPYFYCVRLYCPPFTKQPFGLHDPLPTAALDVLHHQHVGKGLVAVHIHFFVAVESQLFFL